MNLYNTLLNADVEYGLNKEDEVKNIIKEFFGIPYLNKLGVFHQMDFYCENDYFEIKSRKFNHDKYETTMIGYNKIEFAKKNKEFICYFIFVYKDGIYYYQYNPDDNFLTAIGGRNDRGRPEYKKYYYIPINKLTLLN